MNTIVIYCIHINKNKYVGRTTNYEKRKLEHMNHYYSKQKVHKEMDKSTDYKFEKLGEYNNVNITGWGKIGPRMEYLWCMRISPELNNHIAGICYYRRDSNRHRNVMKSYELFEKLYRICCA